MSNNYICALDIGSSKIAACVAGLKRRRINNIFFDSIPSKGIRCGAIVDSIDLVNSISKLLKNLKAKSGINIKSVCSNISGRDITTKHARAIIPLAERGNKVITALDMQEVNEQARILGSSLEEEIIHLIPYSYSIDAKDHVRNPLGLYSHKLEVDLYLVCARLSSVQSLSRAINQAGYDLKKLSFSGLATSKAVLDSGLKGLNLFCDIGSDITELIIFEDGLLKDIEILPVGGDDLTKQLAEEFKIPFDLAEDIKRSYGVIASPEQIGEDKEILVKKEHLYKPIKQRLVSQIISSQAKSLCSALKGAVDKKVSCYKVDKFVVAGRTILLEGFIETLENALSVPVKFGRILDQEILSAAEGIDDLSGQKYLSYLTCLGMMHESLQSESAAVLPQQQPARNFLQKTINRVKEVYQEYF